MNQLRPLLPLLLLAWTIALPAQAEDTVVLKNGDSRSGQITAETPEGLTFRYSVRLSNGEMGFTSRDLPRSSIDYVEFAPLPGEKDALDRPDQAPEDLLRELWLARLKHLPYPRSTAPRLGLTYASRLAAQESKFPQERALEVYGRVESSSWDEDVRAEATQGRLQTLLRLGRVDEAMAEARQMAGQIENPTILLEAKYVLASAEFDQLKRLEEEHPRWQLDDEVRPLRHAHFHSALELFLYPYLFHGSLEPQAARGLLGAAEVHRFAGDLESAGKCAQDITILYPESGYLAPAQSLLEQISQPITP